MFTTAGCSTRSTHPGPVRELLTTVPPLAVQVTVNVPCRDDSTLIVTSTDETVNVWNMLHHREENNYYSSIMHNSAVKIYDCTCDSLG